MVEWVSAVILDWDAADVCLLSATACVLKRMNEVKLG